jgi:proteasome lid subunit RPN8/RPN11
MLYASLIQKLFLFYHRYTRKEVQRLGASLHLSIHRQVIDELTSYCYEQLPAEGYGFLAGTGREITHFFPLRILDPSPCSFGYEPEEYWETIKKIKSNHLSCLGIIHTHPHLPAYPTQSDAKYWERPDLSCWILSFREPEKKLSAFQIQSGQVNPLIYEIIY